MSKKYPELLRSNLLGNTTVAQCARGVFAHFIGVFFETLNLKPLLLETKIKGEEDLPELSNGALCLTAHLGNWDLLAAWAVENNYKLSVLGREARGGTLHNLLAKLRDKHKIKTLWRESGGRTGTVRMIAAAWRRGEIVAALIDQDLEGGGLYLDFFGELAKQPSSLISMAIEKDIPIFCAFIVKTLDGSYEIQIKSVSKNGDLIEVLQEYNRHLENEILQHPCQWVWFHKRWRSRSDEIRLSSSEYIKFLEEGCQNTN